MATCIHLEGCNTPGVSGGSKVRVSACTPDVVNSCESKAGLLFVDSLGMVDLLQQGPGLFKLPGSLCFGGRPKAKGLSG